MWNLDNPTNENKFGQVVSELLEKVSEKAASGDSRVKFGAGHENAYEYTTAYGTAQCTPDLSKEECRECLRRAMTEIPKCCGTKKGGRVVKLSCNVRFESDLFYDLSAENISSSSANPPLDSSDQGTYLRST